MSSGAHLYLVILALVSSLACGDSTPNVTHEADRCIWKGQCFDSYYVSGGKFNCFYNGKPTKLENGTELFELINKTCPRYLERGEVCCDVAQMNTLHDQIKTAQQLFARCPACVSNFVSHFCAATCDPDMSLFIDIPDGSLTQLNDTTWYITSVNVRITEEYANNLYNSCKSVQYPQASNKVISIMCGGTGTCNPEQWLKFLGSPIQNGESPFPMNYFFSDSVPGHPEMIPRNASTADFYACNDTRDNITCSCSDCPAVCPPPPEFSTSHFPVVIVEISITAVGGSISVVVFIVALMVAVLCKVRKSGYVSIASDSAQHSKYGTVGDEEKKYRDESPTNSVGSINSDQIPVDVKKPTSSSSSLCHCYAKIGCVIENRIQKVFYYWGRFAAKYWYLVLLFSLLICAALSFGLFFFKVTTDPVELWSAPTSRARKEKEYFDTHFNPFYRTEQIIVTARNPESNFTFQPIDGTTSYWTFGPVFNQDVLTEVLQLQNYLTNMKVPYTDNSGSQRNITLSDICFKPANDYCTIESVLNYFQNSLENLDYTEQFGLVNSSYHIHYCTRNPTATKSYYYKSKNISIPCLAKYGGFVDPNVALGGFQLDENGEYNYDTATALLVTFLVNNHIDKNSDDYKMAEAWETAYLNYLHNYTREHVNTSIKITFSSERSIVDEINRESTTDIYTIAVSYLLMFLYITLFLGHIRSFATIFVDLKILVGLFGVGMVLVAVLAALGLLSYIGITGSLIIIEVVPFLVLAVGVDNLFILVHSYERQAKKLANRHHGNLQQVPVPELIGRALGEVAPSLLLTSLSETSAFLLGGVSTMPAVRSFSFYAGTAVFFNFLLQVTAFVSVLSLDARRQIANRLELAFCIKLKDKFDPRTGKDFIFLIMRYFAKLVLHRYVRPFILLIYGFTLTVCLALVFQVQIGLSQTIALPKDSYLNPYFSEMNKYLHIGPPVYFVIEEGFNYSDFANQNKICSGAGCDGDSVGSQITIYSRLPDVTRIAEPAMLWMDTYFEWISPTTGCCGINETEPNQECTLGESKLCLPCLQGRERPNSTEFEEYISSFLNTNPSQECAAGGHAAFSSAVKLEADNKTVNTSYIMTYHTILKNSSEYIAALRHARNLGDNFTKVLNVTVFPYSVFYVYYEQYLSTIHDMALNIGLSLGAVFFVSVLLLGLNVWAAVIVLLTVSSIIAHMLGSMGVLDIHANAVSLVNLVMTVGIAVEFCSHIVRAFCSCTLTTRYERAYYALSQMGASVFSGITITKFLGVFILFFAKSQIFEVYYFRMYMCMLVWGALHGLVYLPVFLSFVGPPSYPMKVSSPYSDDYMTTDTSHPPTVPPHDLPHTRVTPQPQPPVTSQSQPHPEPHPQPTLQSDVYPNLPGREGEEIPYYTGGQYPQPTYPRQHRVDEHTRLVDH